MGYKEDIQSIIVDISSVILECESLEINSLEYNEYYNRSNLIIDRVGSIYDLSFDDNYLLSLLLLELKNFKEGLSNILLDYKKKFSLLEYYNLKYNLIIEELEIILIEYKLGKRIFNKTFSIINISIYISYLKYHISINRLERSYSELNLINNNLYLNSLEYIEYINNEESCR